MTNATTATGMISRRETVELTEARALARDTGGLTAYFSTFGTINAHREIIVQGAYDTCAPAFTRDGWLCTDHDWSFEKRCGYIDATRRDTKGQIVDAVFHGDADAQLVRTRTMERMDAGKSVLMSYAFDVAPSGYRTIPGKEAVKHLINPTPEDVAFCEAGPVALIHEIARVYEASIVSVPSEKHAHAVAVRSDAPVGTQTREHEDGDDCALPNLDTQILFAALVGTLDALYVRAFCKALYWNADTWTKDEKIEHVRKAFEECAVVAVNAMNGILADDAMTDEFVDEMRAALGDVADASTTDDAAVAIRTDRKFQDQIDDALGRVRRTLDRAEGIEAVRRRDGKRYNPDGVLAIADECAALGARAAAIAGRNTVAPATTEAAPTPEELRNRLLALRLRAMKHLSPQTPTQP
jgi:hypothetical protein